MRTTIGLLVVYPIALVIGLVGTPKDAQLYAAAIIVPAIILDIVFVVYCRRRKLWSYVGAMVLGIALLLIQVGIGTQSAGPPAGIEAFYVVFPALVALKSYESVLELRG